MLRGRRLTGLFEGETLGAERAGRESSITGARGGLRALTQDCPPFYNWENGGSERPHRERGGAESGAVADALGGSELTHLVEGAVGPPTLGLHHHIGV